jgi:hypothetical protein
MRMDRCRRGYNSAIGLIGLGLIVLIEALVFVGVAPESSMVAVPGVLAACIAAAYHSGEKAVERP